MLDDRIGYGLNGGWSAGPVNVMLGWDLFCQAAVLSSHFGWRMVPVPGCCDSGLAWAVPLVADGVVGGWVIHGCVCHRTPEVVFGRN